MSFGKEIIYQKELLYTYIFIICIHYFKVPQALRGCLHIL